MSRKKPLLFIFLAAAFAACRHAPPTPDQAAAARTNAWLWFSEPRVRYVQGYGLEATCPAQQSAARPIKFRCMATSHDQGPAAVRARISGADERSHFALEKPFYLWPGANPFTLEWDAGALPPGKYTAQISIWRPPLLELAAVEVRLTKVDRLLLDETLEEAKGRLHVLQARFNSLEGGIGQLPVNRAELAVANDYVPDAESAISAGDWLRAHELTHFIAQTAEEAHSALAFMEWFPERAEPAPRHDMTALRAHPGGFWTDDQPVFLFGLHVSDGNPGQFERMARYGLNAAVLPLEPLSTSPPEEFRRAISRAVQGAGDAAAAQNLALTLSFPLDTMPLWAFEKWPQLAEGKPYDLTHPAAKKVLTKRLNTVLAEALRQNAVRTVSLDSLPDFRMASTRYQSRFARFLEASYPDIYTLNATWRTRFPSFDAISVAWQHWGDEPAYTYHLNRFHRGVVGGALAELRAEAASRSPDMAVQLNTNGLVAIEDVPLRQLDMVSAAAHFEVLGCPVFPVDGETSLMRGYVDRALHYTLLDSLSGGTPLVNPREGLFGEHPSEADSRAIRTLCWESVIAGADGLFAPALGADGFAAPETLAAYAASCAEVNRLAALVRAFQDAPAPVAILWSDASGIFRGGHPYLASMRNAYEGSAWFGHKVRFITEEECAEGGLERVEVLVVPKTPSMPTPTLEAVNRFITSGGVTIRTPSAAPFEPAGTPRRDVLEQTKRTVLVSREDSPANYLHAMDAANVLAELPDVARAVNRYGYPLEGVKSRFVRVAGHAYLYIVNLREAAVGATLTGGWSAGRDILNGRNLSFPTTLTSREPMLIRLEEPVSAPDAPPEEPHLHPAGQESPPPERRFVLAPPGAGPDYRIQANTPTLTTSPD